MNIDSIKNGYVIDHIKAGNGMKNVSNISSLSKSNTFIFKLELLSLPQLLITLGISFSIVFIVEAEKLIERLVKKNK